ncbi:hypothetical protein EVAR_56501_1 [Eumeta japonica]|uniref:Uncharacterized protein n=1 Tax=Eumeta variegata TaxID=151549 RepID=A0A4C1XJU9_EUMVA|nr:hypothetical protein EVAR_56501_1 [Eumeta japonica]
MNSGLRVNRIPAPRSDASSDNITGSVLRRTRWGAKRAWKPPETVWSPPPMGTRNHRTNDQASNQKGDGSPPPMDTRKPRGVTKPTSWEAII